MDFGYEHDDGHFVHDQLFIDLKCPGIYVYKYIMSDNDEECQAVIEYMDKTFADAEFSVCLEIDELDDIISNEKIIVIKNSKVDYYDEDAKDFEWKHYFHVIQLDVMSKRNIIFELIKQGVEGDGDHRFLEAIIPTTKGNTTQFDLWWGS